MVYNFMELSDGTIITHTEMIDDKVKVTIEKPIFWGFKHAECLLPSYNWENIDGFSQDEINEFDSFIKSVEHIIIETAIEEVYENASSF